MKKNSQADFRRYLAHDCFAGAYDRVRQLYEEGHKVIVSTSGGKDSAVCTELAIMAARDADALPVDVVTRDEEIMPPGTFEYLERVAERPEVRFHWLTPRMPVLNVFNRECPYWWTFDPKLSPDDWVRKPPPWHEDIREKEIRATVTAERFPPPAGRQSFCITGIRTSESPQRVFAISQVGESLGPANAWRTNNPWGFGVYGARPIYDWKDSDVWKFLKDGQFDYNRAYDVMLKLGVPRRNLRIAPPTQRVFAINVLHYLARGWPNWFDRVCRRLPGVRAAAQFGKRAVEPERQLGETWQQTYERMVLGPKNPEWIQHRGEEARKKILEIHGEHSTAPLPDSSPCEICAGMTGKIPPSWKKLTRVMYLGDPFATQQSLLSVVQPSVFRPEAEDFEAITL